MSLFQIAIAVDQLANAPLGGMADETISARAHRGGWHKTEAVINLLFRDEQHRVNAYLSELRGSQNHPDYRKPKEQ